MNGKHGDHPLTDILVHKRSVFSSAIDGLITEIVSLGGRMELETTYNLLAPPPLEIFETNLRAIRDRLREQAKERGWET